MKLTEVRNALNDAGVYCDHLGRTRGGGFQAKDSYFYHHGRTPEILAKRITVAIPTAKIVEAFDDYHTWPATSYLVVRFTVEGSN